MKLYIFLIQLFSFILGLGVFPILHFMFIHNIQSRVRNTWIFAYSVISDACFFTHPGTSAILLILSQELMHKYRYLWRYQNFFITFLSFITFYTLYIIIQSILLKDLIKIEYYILNIIIFPVFFFIHKKLCTLV